MPGRAVFLINAGSDQQGQQYEQTQIDASPSQRSYRFPGHQQHDTPQGNNFGRLPELVVRLAPSRDKENEPRQAHANHQERQDRLPSGTYYIRTHILSP